MRSILGLVFSLGCTSVQAAPAVTLAQPAPLPIAEPATTDLTLRILEARRLIDEKLGSNDCDDALAGVAEMNRRFPQTTTNARTTASVAQSCP